MSMSGTTRPIPGRAWPSTVAGRLDRPLRTPVKFGDARRVPDGPWQRVILPLAVIEGPVVAILTGLLSAQGLFRSGTGRWCCWSCGDLIGDVIYYWVGRSRRTPLAGLGRRLGMSAVLTPALQRGLRHNAARDAADRQMDAFDRLGGAGRQRHAARAPAALPAGEPARHRAQERVLFGFGYFAGDELPLSSAHAGLAMAGAVRRGRHRGDARSPSARADRLWAGRAER